MKSILKYAVYYLVVFLVFITNIFFTVKDQFYHNLADLPQGQHLYSAMSPDNSRTAEVYRIDTPEGSAIRVELRTFDFTKEDIVESTKNIYWEVDKSIVTVGWEDNNVLTIDDIDLDLSKGQTYDSRRVTAKNKG